MLTRSSTSTLLHATVGAELAHDPFQDSSIDRPAYGLNSRYWIRDLLLSGNQGMVYQAHDLGLNQPCAVKRISYASKDTGALQQRLRHEAEILSVLCHPNIAAVYECTEDEQGNLHSVMEPLDGRDLGSLLTEVTSLSLERTLNILRAVGAALQHAHDLGIVHQDINPSSIFLHKERSRTAWEVEVVKVMNFGMATQLTSASCDVQRNLHLGLVFDSPTYLAPEALELSSEDIDGRADQWSLAVLAYQMLSGQLPFWEKDPWSLRSLIRGATAPVPLSELMPELPFYVHHAIQKALSKDKNQRYGSTADFIRALHGISAPAPRRTKPGLRRDLIEQCRSDSLLAVAPTALPIGKPTKEYPAVSFPAELLASTDEQLALERAQWPVPQLTPPWTGGLESPRPRGVSRPLQLVGCLALALATVVTALHYRHPAPHAKAPRDTSSPYTALPLPAAMVVSSPQALDVRPLALPDRLEPVSVVHKSKSAQSRHSRSRQRASSRAKLERLKSDAWRNKFRQQAIQTTLAEGLGLPGTIR